MNDEATEDYQSIIDQMTWGLRKLNETFGECGRPKVSWQIDPFGHSREMASIFAQMGFDGFFLNRIDYQDLAIRSTNKAMEFIWRGSPDNLGESSDIYTNILFRHYKSPDGLCFDVKCIDEPIVDDISSPEYNVNKKAEDFINNWIVPAKQAYVSNNILVPMGDDFHYQYAGKYFKNMDKLMKYINSKEFNGTKYNAIYSTPSCYLSAVYEATNGTLETALKTDDFFPYASTAHNYWTGYFTSRPTGKRYGRYANNFLQVCKQLSALTNIPSNGDNRLDSLRESLGIFQHHDAITGTEREHVAHDYIRMVHDGIVKCEGITNQTLFKLANSQRMTFTTCPMLNISECGRTEKDNKLIVTIYNALSRPVNKFVRLPIVDDTSDIVITDPSGINLATQIVPIHPSILNVPGRSSKAQFELIFKAENVPALGFKSFYFERKIKKSTGKFSHNKLSFSNAGNAVHRNRADSIIQAEYFYYNGNNGNYSSDEFVPSQPYVFRPDPENPITKVNSTGTDVTYEGPLVIETHKTFGDFISQIHRVYENYSIEEYGYLVGPLPYEKQGIEVVGRYTITGFDHAGDFYTDTNSRGFIQRIRDYRPSWNVTIAEPEAGNYYPVTSNIFFKSNESDIVLFTDRAQGGTSPGPSQLELMIHRNTMSGGPGALAEPLNEQAYGTGVVTRGSHYILIQDSDLNMLKEEAAQNINIDTWIFFASPNGVPYKNYRNGHIMEFSGLNSSLPRQVHILTLEPWGPSTILLRLENFIGKENLQHSKTVSVNIKDLFSTFEVLSLKETTLGGNQWLEDNQRIQFNKKLTTRNRKQQNEDEFIISLDPMEIRTFVLKISYI